jgi:uncharacterized protein (TIGR03435 family)
MPGAGRAALALLLTASQSGPPARAQAAPDVQAAFEVVSVKPDQNPAAQIGVRPVVGNRFSAVITLNLLIAVAYGERSTLLESQVVDAPSWAATDRYEFNATFEGTMASVPGGPPDRLMSMVKRMLAERFKLRIHQETRQVPVYDLVVADPAGRLGPRLTNPPGACVRVGGALPANFDFSTSCGFKRFGPTVITAKAITLETFAGALGQQPDVKRVVRDRTGLAGEFDLALEYVPLSADPQSGPGLTTALRDQLGLSLRSSTGPVEVFVVDGLERPAAD